MAIGVFDSESMTSRQREVHDAIASGPRGSVPWPFLAMLDGPDLALAIQNVGAGLRFASSMTPYMRELATLATAAAFGSGYEWDYHVPIARREGLSPTTIQAALDGRTDGLEEIDGLVVSLCRAAVLERRIPTHGLERLIELTDRSIATTLVAIAGYYPLLALFLAASGRDHPPSLVGKVGD